MWIELHDSVREHPKVLKLAKRLGVVKVQAIGHVVSLWCWTLRMAPDGDLGSFDTEDLEIAAEWDGAAGAFIDAALAVKLIDQGEHGLVVHDWADFAGSLKSAQRVRNHRAKKRETEAQKRVSNVTETNSNVRKRRPTDRPTDQTDRPDRPVFAQSASHSAPSAALVLAEPAVETLPLVDGSSAGVTASDIASWSRAFPAVNVTQALGHMRAWLEANPAKRKTPKGWRRFVVDWLGREQNRGGARGPPVQSLTRKGEETRKALQAAMDNPDMFAEVSRGKA